MSFSACEATPIPLPRCVLPRRRVLCLLPAENGQSNLRPPPIDLARPPRGLVTELTFATNGEEH